MGDVKSISRSARGVGVGNATVPKLVPARPKLNLIGFPRQSMPRPQRERKASENVSGGTA